MDEKTLKELKFALEKEKKTLFEELKTFAVPDKKVKGDWDATYPDMGDDWDENAQEVTEYATRVPIEHELETRLQETEKALERIAGGNYGICEICGSPINIERLKANPAARMCVSHIK